MYYFQMLGRTEFRLASSGKPVRLERLPVLLLAYMVLTRDREHSREAVIETFWPETDPQHGRSRLSSALSRLRTALPSKQHSLIVETAPGVMGLAPEAPVTSDVETYETEVRRHLQADDALDTDAASALSKALELYHGDLLAGQYDTWLLDWRENLLALYVRGQLRLFEYRAARGDLDAALECGRAVLAIDPLRETIHARMITLYIENGEPGSAERQYQICSRLLREELGVGPTSETEAALNSLRKRRCLTQAIDVHKDRHLPYETP